MHLRALVILSTLLVGGLFFTYNTPTFAQNTYELQDKIDETNAQIRKLQDEIKQLQGQITTTAAEKQTLQNAVNALNLNIQKLQKSISLTQTQIKQKDSQISTISVILSTTTKQITVTQQQVAYSLRQLEALDRQSLLVTLLSGSTLSSFFDQSNALSELRSQLGNKIEDLGELKVVLESNKSVAEAKKQELSALKQNLTQEQQGLAINKESQTKLLTETKNKESEYQKQLAQKKAQQAQFESDLSNFEAQLNLKFNVSSLPTTGQGSLQWPTDAVRITQYFGNTDFATKNPQVYSGKGHNAIDLGIPNGTALKAARTGVVLGIGNTDTACAGASYGKWVFIKHDNGLSTLYAHLSSFSVKTGDTVTTGQLIGYSGSTGYATGPHLHFGVYASQGSEIASFASKSCKGKVYTMPVADVSAYLNPLTYLPAR